MAAIVLDANNVVLIKGSYAISAKGGDDPQRGLWTLVRIYFADVDFYGLESCSAHIRSHKRSGQTVNGKC